MHAALLYVYMVHTNLSRTDLVAWELSKFISCLYVSISGTIDGIPLVLYIKNVKQEFLGRISDVCIPIDVSVRRDRPT